MTTPRRVIKDVIPLSVCLDCYWFLVYDEAPEDSEQTEEDLRRARDRCAGKPTNQVVVGSADADDETDEFSWSECDMCGSSLGGSRHPAAILVGLDGTEVPDPTRDEKIRLRHYYGWMRLRFNADGTVDGQKGSSWGLLLTSRQWMETLVLWRQEKRA